jgi:hypothetical protein
MGRITRFIAGVAIWVSVGTVVGAGIGVVIGVLPFGVIALALGWTGEAFLLVLAYLLAGGSLVGACAALFAGVASQATSWPGAWIVGGVVFGLVLAALGIATRGTGLLNVGKLLLYPLGGIGLAAAIRLVLVWLSRRVGLPVAVRGVQPKSDRPAQADR